VGHHTVRALSDMGARVAVGYRPKADSAGPGLAAELGAPAVAFDVLDEASVQRGFEGLEKHFDRLDFLVHCLVHVPPGSLEGSVLGVSRDDFALALEVGVRSLFVTTRHALPLLRRSPAPRIVVLFSAGGEFAISNYHLIGIVKGALASGLRYLAQELGPVGVLCNGVSFSILETGAAEKALGHGTVSQTHAYVTKHSMTRQGLSFDHVTSAIAFLASAGCQNMTGEVLTVDGGYGKNYF
jgi:enoyl-[acyl-carrier protein] reductase I